MLSHLRKLLPQAISGTRLIPVSLGNRYIYIYNYCNIYIYIQSMYILMGSSPQIISGLCSGGNWSCLTRIWASQSQALRKNLTCSCVQCATINSLTMVNSMTYWWLMITHNHQKNHVFIVQCVFSASEHVQKLTAQTSEEFARSSSPFLFAICRRNLGWNLIQDTPGQHVSGWDTNPIQNSCHSKRLGLFLQTTNVPIDVVKPWETILLSG